MLSTLLGPILKSKTGDVATSSVDSEVIGIYFSAHWCPPCRMFTPLLARVYVQAKSLGKSFEVVFVSSDKSIPDFEGYYREMPWLAVPFNDAHVPMLKSRFGIQGIPTLVMVNKDGGLVTKDGRAEVQSPTFITSLPDAWKPPADTIEGAMEELDEMNLDVEEKRSGLETLEKIFSNIIRDFENAKYRTLKKDNKVIVEKLHKPIFIKMLKGGGFVENKESNVYHCPQSVPLSHIQACHNIISVILETLQDLTPKSGDSPPADKVKLIKVLNFDQEIKLVKAQLGDDIKINSCTQKDDGVHIEVVECGDASCKLRKFRVANNTCEELK